MKIANHGGRAAPVLADGIEGIGTIENRCV
jgi:hypothetical protein